MKPQRHRGHRDLNQPALCALCASVVNPAYAPANCTPSNTSVGVREAE